MQAEDRSFDLDLLDNGIDFILRGIDELFDAEFNFRDHIHPTEVSVRSYKYGTLHLFAGFLLIIKEKLHRYDEDIIFEPDTRRNRRNQTLRRTRTVNYSASIRLLRAQVGFSFTEEESEIIEQIQDFRNELEHYKVTEVDIHNIWRILSSFLRIIDKFLHEQLNITIEELPQAGDLFNKIHHISTVVYRLEEQRRNQWYKEARQRANHLSEVRAELRKGGGRSRASRLVVRYGRTERRRAPWSLPKN